MKKAILLATLFCVILSCRKINKNIELSEFVPEGYSINDKIFGDLNGDNENDCVLIIKGTDKSRIIRDEDRGELDRNRRGIIVLLKQKEGYQLVAENDSCFTSENEDGGVYFAPEMSVKIANCELQINYNHGRYGHWFYTFRLKDSDFELVKFSLNENRGPITERSVDINFLTSEMQIKTNMNEEAEKEGDEVFQEEKKKLSANLATKLSKIADFEELYLLSYE